MKFLLYFVIALLLGIGAFRIFSLVLHDPVLGYANQTDMIRVQSCHYLWPLDPNIAPGQPTPRAPLEDYKRDTQIDLTGRCLPGSELIFTAILVLIIKIMGLENGFLIQILGAIQGLLLSICAVGFSLWLLIKERMVAALSNALIYAIVLADPANTLYFNTFYSEFSALFFLYLSLLLFYACLCQKSLFLSLLLSISLVLLSLSRHQHLALPMGILLSLLMINWRNLASIKYIATGVSVGAVVSLIGQAYIFSQDHIYYRHITNLANATDTFLGMVLPSASDPDQAAQILGLPKQCVDYGGKTWYSPGFATNHPCPEVTKVSRFKLLWLALEDPSFLVNSTNGGIQRLRPWILNYLGHIGNQNFGQVTQIFSISRWLDELPILFLKVAFLIPGLIYFLGCVHLIKGIPISVRNLATLMTAITSLMYIVFFSALFGDGYIEFQKHTHLFFSLYLALLIISIVSFLGMMIPRVYSRLCSSLNQTPPRFASHQHRAKRAWLQ